MVPVVVICIAAMAWRSLPSTSNGNRRTWSRGEGKDERGTMPGVVADAMVARFDVYRPAAAEGLPVMVARPAVETESPPGYGLGPHFGSLARLVMEQAVLGAARDERGWTTRVAALGEAPPAGKPDLFVEVYTPYMPGRRCGSRSDAAARGARSSPRSSSP